MTQQQPHPLPSKEPGTPPGTLISAVEDLRAQDVGEQEPRQEEPHSEDYRHYQERLRQAEEHLRMVVDGARDYAIFMVDPQGVVLTWNTGAERMKQWRTHEILGQHFGVLYRPEDQEAGRPEHNLEKARETGMYEETYPRMKKDGTVFIADVTINAIRDEVSGTLRGFAKVVRDVTERQQLLQRLVIAQEEERRRISRELHDQMGQYLAAMGIGLGALKETVRACCPAETGVPAALERLSHMADEMARELHRIAVEMRPTTLEELGVVSTLTSVCEQWSLTTRIPAEFVSAGLDNQRLSELVQTTIYRVVQEALTNIVRHAASSSTATHVWPSSSSSGRGKAASRVSVTLQRLPHSLQLIVEDDGPGFDTEAVGELGRLGIAGMRERAAACGGTLEIESAPGEGTTVYLRIPAELL